MKQTEKMKCEVCGGEEFINRGGQIVHDMADACLNRGLFARASALYARLLDMGNCPEHEVRWEILLAKFKCRGGDELSLCPTFDIHCDEYKLLLLSCNSNLEVLKQYTAIADDQKRNKESGFAAAKRKVKKEKREHWKLSHPIEAADKFNKMTKIVTGCFLSVAALFVLLGIIFWQVFADTMPYNAGAVITFFALCFVTVIGYLVFLRWAKKRQYTPIKPIKVGAWLIMLSAFALFLSSSIVAGTGKMYDGYGKNFYYDVCDHGTICLEKYNGNSKEVKIPSKIDGKKVSEISSIFKQNDYDYTNNVEKIYISDGITNIGDYSFRDCSKLTFITIPSSVHYIGVSAFKNCDGLTSITIPSSVAGIGDDAFYGCYN